MLARVLAVAWLAGCGGEKPSSVPPPLPEVPALTSAAIPGEPAAENTPPPSTKDAARNDVKASAPKPKPTPSEPSRSAKTNTKTSSLRPTRPAPMPTATVPAPKPAAPTPIPTPTVAAPVKPTKRVTIPRTDHVRIEVPAGLQSDLDADPRMQPWIEKVVVIVDGCHARTRSATGTIEALVTMHENERPDADVRSLPAPLSAVVACATGQLLRTKMPLFTGREGTRYTVRIAFQ